MQRLFIFLLAASCVFGGKKISGDLNGKANGSVDVIIRYKNAPTFTDQKKANDWGGSLKKNLKLIKGEVYSMPASKIKDIADDPNVEFVAPDRPDPGSLATTAASRTTGM